MAFDEQFRSTLETLADRLREEIATHVAKTAEELTAAVEAERSSAAAEAARESWATAEQEVSARLTSTLAAAEERAAKRASPKGWTRVGRSWKRPLNRLAK